MGPMNRKYGVMVVLLAATGMTPRHAFANAEACARSVEQEMKAIFHGDEKVAADFKEAFGDELFTYRLAAAEILDRADGSAQSHLQPRAREMLAAIRDNAPERIDMSQLNDWRSFLSSVRGQSDLVRRLRLAAEYESKNAVPLTLGQALTVELAAPAEAKEEPKKVGFFKKMFGGGKQEKAVAAAKEATSLARVEYLNVEQFIAYLSRYPVEARTELCASLDAIASFAHVEVMQILAELPPEGQKAVYTKLRTKIIGRVDFFQPEFFMALRDPRTGEVLIDRSIMARELTATGSGFRIPDLMRIMEALDLSSADRSEILASGRDFGRLYSGIKAFDRLDAKDADFVLKALLEKTSTLDQANAALDLVKSKITSDELREDMNRAFARWIEDSAHAPAYKLNAILAKGQGEELLLADLAQYVRTVQYTPVEAYQILRHLRGDVARPAVDMPNPEKGLLPLRDLLRTLTRADRPNDPTGEKGWTAADLVFFNVSYDLDVAVKTIQGMKGRAMNPDIADGIAREFDRVIHSVQLRQLGPADLTPGKEKRGPPMARNVTPERLIQALTKFATERANATRP